MKLYCVYNNLMAEEKQNTGTKVVFEGENHMFLLKRLEPQNTSFVQVDFSPIPSLQQLPSCSQNYKIFPSFNQDGFYFTPAFILPLEKRKTQKYQDTYLKLHDQRRDQMSLEREELFVPRPSKSNSFCCICKAPFEDYLTHVNMPTHQQKLQSSPFRSQILNLTLKFNLKSSQIVKQKKGDKTHRIKKSGRKAKASPKLNSYLSSTTLCNSNQFQQKQEVLV